MLYISENKTVLSADIKVDLLNIENPDEDPDEDISLDDIKMKLGNNMTAIGSVNSIEDTNSNNNHGIGRNIADIGTVKPSVQALDNQTHNRQINKANINITNVRKINAIDDLNTDFVKINKLYDTERINKYINTGDTKKKEMNIITHNANVKNQVKELILKLNSSLVLPHTYTTAPTEIKAKGNGVQQFQDTLHRAEFADYKVNK